MHYKVLSLAAIASVISFCHASPVFLRPRSSACPISDATLDMIIVEEGARFDIYNDQLGAPTIGIGHKCIEANCEEVRREYGIPLTDETMRELLQVDLERFKVAVSTGLAGATLNANQYGAVVSVAFNGGEYAPQLQTFYAAVKGAAPDTLAEQFEAILVAHDLGVGDVKIRRGRELAFFKTATEAAGVPC